MSNRSRAWRSGAHTVAIGPLRRVAWCLVVAIVSSLGADAAPPSPGEPSAEALIDEIPFDPRSRPGTIIIDLAKEGRPAFPLILDTGASMSFITPVEARSLGVNIRRTKSSPYREPTRLGRDLQFWVDVSASDTGVGGGSFEVGLLGANFLDDYVVEIDHVDRMVRFYDPDAYEVPDAPPSDDVTIVPFKRSGRQFFIETGLEGVPTKALVDTGSEITIVGKKAAREVGIVPDALGEEVTMHFLNGKVSTRKYEAKRLDLGSLDAGPAPVLVEVSGPVNFGGPMSMLLGHDVLCRYTLRIDYARRRLWLQSAPDSAFAEMRWPAEPPSPYDNSLPRPSEAEIAAQDAERLERFEQAKRERVYAETPNGGFVVVDGYRLRNGPKEGETWLTHAEMLEILEAREAADAASSGAN